MRQLLRDRGGPLPTYILWFALIIVALWLLSPVLNPVHVEGFSASIIALGIQFPQGALGSFFPSQPFATEYFLLTKLGAALGVSALMQTLGVDGAAAMRLLMWIGFALLCVSSGLLVRRWAQSPWLVTVIALLLMPGVAESAFFFNDNVIGSGLMTTALVIFAGSHSVMRLFLTGLLIGAASSIRIDLVLISVAIPLMASSAAPLRAAAISTAIVAVIAIATLFAAFAVVGMTPLDALRVGSIAVDLWARPGSLSLQLVLAAAFCGVAGFILLLLGIGAAWRERHWLSLALLLGIPLLVNLALAGKIWEIRQLLGLTPFLGALVALGIQRMVADYRAGQRLLPGLVLVTALVTFFAPSYFAYLKDGPREVVGRVAGIALWREWQGAVDRDFATIQTAVSIAKPNETLALLTDQWDEDRYLHLQLENDGYVFERGNATCAQIGQIGRKGNARVLHLSLQQTFVSYWQEIQADRLRLLGMPCLVNEAPSRMVLLVRRDRAAVLFGAETIKAAPPSGLSAIGYQPIIAVELDAAKLARLEATYRLNAVPGDTQRSVLTGLKATEPRTSLLKR